VEVAIRVKIAWTRLRACLSSPQVEQFVADGVAKRILRLLNFDVDVDTPPLRLIFFSSR